MKIPRILDRPTTDAVARAVKVFDDENGVGERALALLVERFAGNTDPSFVLLKVAAINTLYRTQIFGVWTVATHIVAQDIDEDLASGSADAVEKIAKIQFGSKERRNYSFATRYCSWHCPDAYPIFDSRAERCFRAYAQQDGLARITEAELCNYERYRKVMLEFRNRYQLYECSLKDVDKFLYMLGREVFYSAKLR